MNQSFTTIDSFRVTEALSPRLNGLSIGTWFILDGAFTSAVELPAIGSELSVTMPNGERTTVHVHDCKISHGVAAMLFKEPEAAGIQRLSVVTMEG